MGKAFQRLLVYTEDENYLDRMSLAELIELAKVEAMMEAAHPPFVLVNSAASAEESVLGMLNYDTLHAIMGWLANMGWTARDAPSWANYHAYNANGKGTWFSHKPECDLRDGIWITPVDDEKAPIYAGSDSFAPNFLDWRASCVRLTER